MFPMWYSNVKIPNGEIGFYFLSHILFLISINFIPSMNFVKTILINVMLDEPNCHAHEMRTKFNYNIYDIF